MAIDFKGVYQRFVELEILSENKSEFPAMDPVEKRLLNLYSTFWIKRKLITVVEAINITDEISTSTSHRYLKMLRQKGYVELIVDQIDNRVKYVSPTNQADRYFVSLGKLVIKASNIEV